MLDDYYSILGVSSKASKEDIKKAYRKLAVKYHPDKNKGDDTDDKFKKINEAYSVLSDDAKRMQYDSSGFRFSGNAGFSMDDIFKTHFGFGFTEPSVDINQPRKGANIQVKIGLSLYEALFGATKNLELKVKDVCSSCNGTGALKQDMCVECQGRGRVMHHSTHGNMRTIRQHICPRCGGLGVVIKEACSECTSGFVPTTLKLSVDIPEGTKDNATILLRNKGPRGVNNGQRGDVLVHCVLQYPDVSKITPEQKAFLKVLCDVSHT